MVKMGNGVLVGWHLMKYLLRILDAAHVRYPPANSHGVSFFREGSGPQRACLHVTCYVEEGDNLTVPDTAASWQLPLPGPFDDTQLMHLILRIHADRNLQAVNAVNVEHEIQNPRPQGLKPNSPSPNGSFPR